jgi:hypothetical protein
MESRRWPQPYMRRTTSQKNGSTSSRVSSRVTSEESPSTSCEDTADGARPRAVSAQQVEDTGALVNDGLA